MRAELNYSIRYSKHDDIDFIADRLRVSDQIELRAAGITPTKALYDGYSKSPVCMTADVFYEKTGKMEPAVMFGVASFQPHVGNPWMLCTDAIDGLGLAIVRESRRWVSAMSKTYPLLTNHVHRENEFARRWIEVMGFEFPDEEPLVVYATGEEFLRFEFRSGNPCASELT